MVSQEKLAEFKELYLRKYNVKLSSEEAVEMANGLVNLMELLLKPSLKKNR